MLINKSLQDLEKQDYGNPDPDSSFLVRHCIQLTKIPINNFTIEDLRIMISQNFGLTYLVPLAIEKLKKDILAEGDFYPGDLLKSVASIESDFWVRHKQLFLSLKMIIDQNKNEIDEAGILLDKFTDLSF